MWRNLRSTLKTIGTVLRHPAYLAAAVAAAIFILWIYIWLPNFPFYSSVIFSPSYSLAGKLAMAAASFSYFITGFTPLARLLAVLNAALIGVSLSLSAYYFSNRVAAMSGAGMNGVGMLVSLLGIGCGSCGSVILSSLLGIGGASSLVQKLPLGGYTFDVLGTMLILVSVYLTAAIISRPAICKIPAAPRRKERYAEGD